MESFSHALLNFTIPVLLIINGLADLVVRVVHIGVAGLGFDPWPCTLHMRV